MLIYIHHRNITESDLVLGSFEGLQDCVDAIMNYGIFDAIPIFLTFKQVMDEVYELLSHVEIPMDGASVTPNSRRYAKAAGVLLASASHIKDASDLIAYGPLDREGFPVYPVRHYTVSVAMVKAMISRLPLEDSLRINIIPQFLSSSKT